MISALMFSPRTLWDFPRPQGRELRIVHNLRAAAPLARGAFAYGKEWWAEEGGLVLTDHRAPLPLDDL